MTRGSWPRPPGLAILLNEGIGDTIRVSLTPEPGAPREREVEIAQQVLQSMGLRSFLPQVSACPGCGRTTSTFFQEMAQQIQGYLKDQMPVWRETHPGAEELRVAVMGCVVNGPGESKHADIGISLPGTFEEPVAPVFIDGRLDRTLRGEGLVAEFITILEDYVERRYPSPSPSDGGRSCRPRFGPSAIACDRPLAGRALDARIVARRHCGPDTRWRLPLDTRRLHAVLTACTRERERACGRRHAASRKPSRRPSARIVCRRGASDRGPRD